jgi:hypothetical protein
VLIEAELRFTSQERNDLRKKAAKIYRVLIEQDDHNSWQNNAKSKSSDGVRLCIDADAKRT